MQVAAENLRPGQFVQIEINDDVEGTWKTYRETHQVKVAEIDPEDSTFILVTEVTWSSYPTSVPFQTVGRTVTHDVNYWDTFTV